MQRYNIVFNKNTQTLLELKRVTSLYKEVNIYFINDTIAGNKSLIKALRDELSSQYLTLNFIAFDLTTTPHNIH